MNVVQSLGWYFPDSTGGTEVYVAGLAAELRRLGVRSTIAAAQDGQAQRHYEHRSSPVYRYPVGADKSSAQRTGEQPHTGFEHFQRWLQAQDASVFHQHSWTYGCGLHHLRAARQQGMATVLTVHVPGPVCIRGTMLRNGREPCDGVIRESVCSACWLQSLGLGALPSAAMGRIPPLVASRLAPLGRAGTALSATSLVRRQREDLLDAAQSCDRVVAVCQWLFDALLANGVPRDKLRLHRQGVEAAGDAPSAGGIPSRQGPLVIGFLGRGDPLKGLHVLVGAFARLPAGMEIELHVHAMEPTDPLMVRYMDDVRRVAAADRRIRMLGPLARDAVPAFLRSVDVLAVPSQWFETGPLVAMEALACGTPVLGSRLGGLCELVRQNESGWLVEHGDVTSWSAQLERLAAQADRVRGMRSGWTAARTMRDVAQETVRLYAEVTA